MHEVGVNLQQLLYPIANSFVCNFELFQCCSCLLAKSVYNLTHYSYIKQKSYSPVSVYQGRLWHEKKCNDVWCNRKDTKFLQCCNKMIQHCSVQGQFE